MAFNGKFIPLHKRKAHNAGVKRRNAARRSAKRRPTFAKKVKAVMQSTAEHKIINFASASYMPNYVGGAVPQLQLNPNSGYNTITQGTGQGQRIGNRVRTVKAVLRGIMTPLPYSVTVNVAPCPMEIRFIIGRNKGDSSIAPPLGVFMQNGSTTSAPQGGLVDMINPLNTDTQTVYKQKFFKLGYATGTGSGSAVIAEYQANNDFKMNCKVNIDITKYLPKTISWNDTTTTPYCSTTWLTILAAYADGSNPTTLATQPNLFTWEIEYTYEDF